MQFAKDDLLTVMPRILDPTLRFDEEAIIKGLQSSKEKYASDKKNYNNDSVAIDIPEEKTSIVTVAVKYKYHMLAVLVSVIIIFLCYKMYNHYFGKKNKEVQKKEQEPEPEPILVDTKDSNINYLNNFISSDSDDDDEEQEQEQEPEIIKPKFIHTDMVVNKLPVIEESQEQIPESQESQEQITGSQEQESQEQIPESQEQFPDSQEQESQDDIIFGSQTSSLESQEIPFSHEEDFLLKDAIDVFNRYN